MTTRTAERWQALVRGQADGFGRQCARAALGVLSLPYRAALGMNLAVFQRGLVPQARLGCPVISVGNLTLGGTGKTSSAAFIARYLRERGERPAIILRGHAAKSRATRVLAPPVEAADPNEVGDEAAMLSACLPDVPVGVGKWRERVGRALLRETGANVIVLDDGFQYFRMARDLDVVLVDALQPLEEQRLFPAGTLREPPGHLRRAHAVWLTHADLVEAGEADAARQVVSRLCPGIPIAATRHRPLALRRLHRGDGVDPGERLGGTRVLALSSIGNPRAFELTLSRLGAQEVVPLRFPDHHPYSEADAARVARAASGLDLIVTTEKDAVRFGPVAADTEAWVLRCELEFLVGAEEALSLVQSVLR